MCFVYFMEKNTYLCSMILEKLSIINYKNIAEASLELSPKINCLIGQNGVGKTTSIGKLAANYKRQGKRVLIASADTFRAAANEQLT